MKFSILVLFILLLQSLNGCSKGNAVNYERNLKIVSVNIPVDAVNVPLNSIISITFDSPMSTSCSNCIVLKQWLNNSTFKPVQGVTSTSGSVIEFSPQSVLLPNTKYYVEVSAALNLDNSRLFMSDYTFHSNSSFFFTTTNQLDSAYTQAYNL